MRRFVFGQDELVKRFVEHIIGRGETFDADAVAIGLAEDNDLLGGAVYSEFRQMQHGNDIRVHAGFRDPSWASRRVLATFFAYPFEQCGCTRITTVTCKNNKKARAFDERLGFQYVGKLSRGWDGKRDAVVYEMLKENCKWLRQPMKKAA